MKNAHDRVFVVTAPGFDDRQESARLALGPDNFEFVFGVNKSSTTIEELAANGHYDEARAIALDRNDEPMSLGHICCSLGHQNAYRKIVEYRIARALIFEDDIVVNVSDDEKINAAAAAIPEDADLIYWSWQGGENVTRFAGLEKWSYKILYRLGRLKLTPVMIDNLYARPYDSNFKVAGKHFWTNAYTVTLAGAERLLDLNSPVVLNADKLITYAILTGAIRGYVSINKFFGQRSSDPNDELGSYR